MPHDNAEATFASYLIYEIYCVVHASPRLATTILSTYC